MPSKDTTVKNLKEEVEKLQAQIADLDKEPKPSPSREKSVKTLFRWQSFTRPYKKQGKKWFIYTFLFVSSVIIILLFTREFIVIAPVLALTFVGYILVSKPPQIIENEITTHGINTARDSYIWEELDDFWIITKRGNTYLYVDTFLQWPRRLMILINDQDSTKIRDLLGRYIPFREIPKTSILDTVADGLSHGFHKLTS